MADVVFGEKLTIKEACDAFGVSRGTLNRWMTAGVRGRRLPSLKVGGKRLLLRADLEAFVERHGCGPDRPPLSTPRREAKPRRADAAARELARLWGRAIA